MDKNESVMGFMKQIVQEKYGDTIDANFREQEVNRIYDEFVDKLVNHFKPMVSEKGKEESAKLNGQSVDQNMLLGLLMDSVENLEQKIVSFLKIFR